MQKDAPSCARVVVALLLVVAPSGCTRTTGPMPLGAVAPATETVSVMRLRPGATVTSCRRWFAGILLHADPDDPVARLLATEPEADVLSDGTLRVEEYSIGPYVRQCVTFDGALSRTIRTVRIPTGGPTEGHHHH